VSNPPPIETRHFWDDYSQLTLNRFDARTPVAPPLVPKPAMNATSNVLGLVLTKAHARCLVQHHATAFLAIEDAKESWTAVIDVQASAERNALLSIVRNAATRK